MTPADQFTLPARADVPVLRIEFRARYRHYFMPLPGIYGDASWRFETGPAARLDAADADALFQQLGFECARVKRARDRTRWTFGRIYNWLMLEELDYVHLTGTQPWQALSVSGLVTPDCILRLRVYQLRYDYALAALGALAGQSGGPT